MDFEALEDAIIVRLKAQLPYVRTCATYAGQFSPSELARKTVKYPAVFVSYAGSEFDPVDGPQFNESASFTLIVAAKNLRSDERARKDADSGAYKLVKDCITALTNQALGLTLIHAMTPQNVQLVFVDSGVAVYSIEFNATFDTTYDA